MYEIAEKVPLLNGTRGQVPCPTWEKYPAPHHLAEVTLEELTAFLRECSNNACSTSKAQQILDLIKKDGDTKRDYQNNRDFLVRSIVRDIQFKKQEIGCVEAELKTVMSELDYKLETMPGINTVTAAELVTEIRDIHSQLEIYFSDRLD